MTARAGKVYEAERDIAITRQRDLVKVQKLGRAAMIRQATQTRAEAIRQFRRGDDKAAVATVVEGLRDFQPLLTEAMTYAWMMGWARAADETADQFSDNFTIAAAKGAPVTSPTYRKAITFLRNAQKLNPEAIQALTGMIERNLIPILATASSDAQKQLQSTMIGITRDQLSTKPAVERLEAKFHNLGISPKNPYQLEAIFRTQTQLAYAAGQEQLLKEPAVDEQVWGFKYVTVGDDRVRNSHVALDGVTLPKSDPFWQENSPPNGYACRCQKITLFDERKIVRPPAEVEVDGKKVRPGADKGFGWNPGNILSTGGNSPVKLAPPPSTTPEEDAKAPLAPASVKKKPKKPPAPAAIAPKKKTYKALPPTDSPQKLAKYDVIEGQIAKAKGAKSEGVKADAKFEAIVATKAAGLKGNEAWHKMKSEGFDDIDTEDLISTIHPGFEGPNQKQLAKKTAEWEAKKKAEAEKKNQADEAAAAKKTKLEKELAEQKKKNEAKAKKLKEEQAKTEKAKKDAQKKLKEEQDKANAAKAYNEAVKSAKKLQSKGSKSLAETEITWAAYKAEKAGIPPETVLADMRAAGIRGENLPEHIEQAYGDKAKGFAKRAAITPTSLTQPDSDSKRST